MDVAVVLARHSTHISEDDKAYILNSIDLIGTNGAYLGIDRELEDLSVRTCECGYPIDGFDTYIEHILIQLVREQGDA